MSKRNSKKIVDNKADYVLAVKGNQNELFEQVKDEFLFSKTALTHENLDFGHGRIEMRKCYVLKKKDFNHVTAHEEWKGIKSIIKIESTRDFKNKDLVENATRYYISSLNESSENIYTLFGVIGE